jgi:hypothetical protein
MENGESAYEAGSDLRKGLVGPTEGGAHNCESNGSAALQRHISSTKGVRSGRKTIAKFNPLF